MNTETRTGPERPVLIWDAPVRVFHWLLVLSFAGAWLTAESERWRLVHVTLGYTVGALVLWRAVWGLVGTRHARFAAFVRGPSAVIDHVDGLLRGRPEATPGHNPVGALAIVALLLLAAATVATGWVFDQGLSGEWLSEVHEALASLMLALAGVHVAGVLLGSRLTHENLVRAMVTGRKRAAPGQAIGRAWRPLAALMVVAVLGFWAWQWQTAPADGKATMAAQTRGDAAHGSRRGHDDDD